MILKQFLFGFIKSFVILIRDFSEALPLSKMYGESTIETYDYENASDSFLFHSIKRFFHVSTPYYFH